MSPRNLYNPDPRRDMPAIRRINDSAPRITDNVQIVDHGKSVNDWKDSGAYNKDVEGSFNYTDKNWQEGFNKAAREGKPVVVVFGSEKTSHTKSLIDGPTKGSRDGGKDAVYIFVDKNRIDKSTELGEYAEKNVGNDPDMAYTGIFSLTPDQDGKPHLGKLVANTWGARGEISSVIQDQLQYAQRRMDQVKGQFKVPDETKPEPGQDNQPDKKPESQTNPDDKVDEVKEKPKEIDPEVIGTIKRVDQQRVDIFGSIAKAGKDDGGATRDYKDAIDEALQFKTGEGEHQGLTKLEREALLDKAVTAADTVKPEDIKVVRDVIKQQLEVEKNKGANSDTTKIENLENYGTSLDHLEMADGIARFERGLFHLNEGEYDDGVKDIKEAFKRHPELAEKPAYRDRMAKTFYAGAELDGEFPELKLKERKQELANGTKPESSTTNDTKPVPEENVPESSPSDKKVEDGEAKVEPTDKPEAKVEEEVVEVKDKPAEVDESKLDQEALDKLTSAQTNIRNAISRLSAAKSANEATALFNEAISAADGMNTADVNRVMAMFNRDLASESSQAQPNPEAIANINGNITGLDQLKMADGSLRINKGMFLMSQDGHDGAPADAAKQGFDLIVDGAKRHPELLDNPEVVSPVVAMAKAKGIDANQLNESLPYDAVQKEMAKIGFVPEVKDATKPDAKVEKKPEKIRFEQVDSLEGLNAAMKAAHDSNRELVLDFRADWCGPCRTAEKFAWPDKAVNQTIDDNAIFAKIDLTHSPKELESFSNSLGVKAIPENIVVDIVQTGGKKVDGVIPVEGTEYGLKVKARTGEDFTNKIGQIMDLQKQGIGSHNQALYSKYQSELAELLRSFLDKNTAN